MSEDMIKQLIQKGVIGYLNVTDDGKIALELFIGNDRLNFGQLNEIQEGMNKISNVLIDYFNNLGGEDDNESGD